MYIYIVDRTQIYLTSEESAALERASIKTGKTRSRLIREAIDEKYSVTPSFEDFMAAVDGAFGIWAGEAGREPLRIIAAGRRAETRQSRKHQRALAELADRDPDARSR